MGRLVKLSQSLPSAERAVHYHCLRVHLQISVMDSLIHAMMLLSEDGKWTIGIVHPVTTDPNETQISPKMYLIEVQSGPPTLKYMYSILKYFFLVS